MQGEGGPFDWLHAASGLGGAVIGAIGSIGAFLYRAGGREPALRADFQKRVNDAEQRVEEKIEGMTGHFHEYFEGIRRQQDDIKLSMERDFVRKHDLKELREELRGDLREFRDENRDDMSELKRNISKILGEKT